MLSYPASHPCPRSRYCSDLVFWMNSAVGDVVAGDDVVVVVVCISAACAVALSPHVDVVVGGAVVLRPAVVVGCDTAVAVDIAVDQIFSPCCPHTP